MSILKTSFNSLENTDDALGSQCYNGEQKTCVLRLYPYGKRCMQNVLSDKHTTFF